MQPFQKHEIGHYQNNARFTYLEGGGISTILGDKALATSSSLHKEKKNNTLGHHITRWHMSHIIIVAHQQGICILLTC